MKILVLDFDRTMTKSHTKGVAQTAHAKSRKFIQSNIKPGFAPTIHRLADGYSLYIASYADKNAGRWLRFDCAGSALIMRYLKIALGWRYKHWFKPIRQNRKGQIIRGNVIAQYTHDYKWTHLYRIAEKEGLTFNSPDMANILFVDDDAHNVERAHELGCTILVPNDPSASAAMAASVTLFTDTLALFC